MRLLAASNSADSGCWKPEARQISPACAAGASAMPKAAKQIEVMRVFRARSPVVTSGELEISILLGKVDYL